MSAPESVPSIQITIICKKSQVLLIASKIGSISLTPESATKSSSSKKESILSNNFGERFATADRISMLKKSRVRYRVTSFIQNSAEKMAKFKHVSVCYNFLKTRCSEISFRQNFKNLEIRQFELVTFKFSYADISLDFWCKIICLGVCHLFIF